MMAFGAWMEMRLAFRRVERGEAAVERQRF